MLFRVHMTAGLALGAYMLVISLSGAALLFRPELQQRISPELFPPEHTTVAMTIGQAAEAIARARPELELVGIGAPTPDRHTYLGYVFDKTNNAYEAVFADVDTGRILGSPPAGSIVLWLQDLHFNLLGGSTGHVVNGVGSLAFLIMAGTGFAVWWPGRNREGRTRERIRLVRGAHGTVGAVVFAWMAMWAVTGAYFVFPAPFRNVVQRISAPADAVAVVSMDDESVHARPDLDRLVAHAETSLPEGASVTRISLPTVDTGTIQVVLTTGEPTPWEGDRHVSFEFDQFTGELLLRRDLAERSGGERLLPWFGRLHMGGFGGEFVRIAWTLAALGTAGLSVSGFVMWWRRAHVRRRWR